MTNYMANLHSLGLIKEAQNLSKLAILLKHVSLHIVCYSLTKGQWFSYGHAIFHYHLWTDHLNTGERINLCEQIA